ncbi:hypothetical protein V6L77_23805 [Pannonibacter sp. Pt2-lr]
MLQISDLTYRIGGRLLIDNASVTLPARSKTGLVAAMARANPRCSS